MLFLLLALTDSTKRDLKTRSLCLYYEQIREQMRLGTYLWHEKSMVWAAGPIHEKKKFGADYEKLLRAVFSTFCGQKEIFENIIASALITWNNGQKIFFFMI